MSTDTAAVEKKISEFLGRVEKAPEALTPDLVLQADGIGLNSLEIAELSAVLEDEFGTDPFSGEDDTADIDAGSRGVVTTRVPTIQAPSPDGETLGDDPATWEGRVSRNAPCPCGSGRKYKHCHGVIGAQA